MKVTYWIAKRVDEDNTYALREMTKSELVKALAAEGCAPNGSPMYRAPEKLVRVFKNHADMIATIMVDRSYY